MTEIMPSLQQLTGQSRQHLACVDGNIFLHQQVIAPFARLQAAAALEGISLAIASGFRDFHRQLAIWNAKVTGQRPVLDRNGAVLDVASLREEELMFAILRWSALPGTSRHHWGTDMDVWDSAAVDASYSLQLVPEEYGPGGPFARLGEWLAGPEVRNLGFFRPYQTDRGGVSPEPWHLSYAPVASTFEGCLDRDGLASVLAGADILLKDVILAHLEEILHRFVVCPSPVGESGP